MGNKQNLLKEFVIDCLTGKNYIDLVQRKRLNQAAYLLENTAMSVLEVGMPVVVITKVISIRFFKRDLG